jgi:replication-associated recombination protein RarA
MTETAAQAPHAPTVADRLRGARRRGFVGRVAELELFRLALEAPEPPFSVLWICGPGGVGKTTLLSALADTARALERTTAQLDMRAIEPSPPAFAAELARLDSPAERDRPVLLLDTFEAASGLEDWLREEFVPGLPAGALVVVAGRERPAAGWRRDPAWRELLRVVALRNLDPDDARALLRRAGSGTTCTGGCSSSPMGIRSRSRCCSTCSPSAARATRHSSWRRCRTWSGSWSPASSPACRAGGTGSRSSWRRMPA